MREDDGAILRPYIGSLAVEACRVVAIPEDREKFLVGDPLLIVGHLYRIGVARGT